MRLRPDTRSQLHASLGSASDQWPRPPSPLRDYALREGPEHLWWAGRPERARQCLTAPGFLARRIVNIGRYETLATWRALGESPCVAALVARLDETSGAPLTGDQWAALGDFLRLGQHRRASIPLLERARDRGGLTGLARARVLRSLAAARWECGTTPSDDDAALALIDEALALSEDSGEWSEERLALLAHRATIAAGSEADHGRRAYEAVLEQQSTQGEDTRSTRMNLANALHHDGQLERAWALLSEVAAEVEGVHGADWPEEWIVLRHNLASVLQSQERFPEALEAFAVAHREACAFYGESHPRTLQVHACLAEVLMALDRNEEATARSLDTLAQCINDHGPRSEWVRLVGNDLLALHEVESPQPRLEGPLLVALQEREADETAVEVALDQAALAMGEGQFCVAELWLRTLAELAAAEDDAEGLAWAIEHWVEVLDELEWERDIATEVQEAVDAVDPRQANMALQELLLGVLERDGRHASVVEAGRRLLAHAELPIAHYRVASALRALERPEEAVDHRRRCWELECAELGASDPDTLQTAHDLALDLLDADRAEEARGVIVMSLASAGADAEDEDCGPILAELQALLDKHT